MDFLDDDYVAPTGYSWEGGQKSKVSQYQPLLDDIKKLEIGESIRVRPTSSKQRAGIRTAIYNLALDLNWKIRTEKSNGLNLVVTRLENTETKESEKTLVFSRL